MESTVRIDCGIELVVVVVVVVVGEILLVNFFRLINRN